MRFLGIKRNQTVSCQDIRLCVLNLHTKYFCHNVLFIVDLYVWICNFQETKQAAMALIFTV